MKALKNTFICFLAATLLFGSFYSYSTSVSATDNCVTERCLEAKKAAEEAQENAAEAEEKVDTLEGKIAQLENEIKVLQAKIDTNVQVLEELNAEIEETSAKLKDQQAAFAEVLVKNYFEAAADSEPILRMASAETVSDYAEREARAATTEEQLGIFANEIKETKQDLEDKKFEVETIVKDQEKEQEIISNNQAEQARLKEQYQDDADGYAAEAEEALKIKKEEEDKRAAEIARANRGGRVVASGKNSYPYQSRCPQENWYFTGRFILAYGGYICECTSYAGWKAYEYWGVSISSWGNAMYWGSSAQNHGYTYNSTPEAHTVGVSTSGAYGHVVWIERVNSDGTIDLSEYNNSSSSISGSRADFGYRVNVPASQYYYIHFD